LNLDSVAQVYQPLTILSPPYENYYNINDFPHSNEKISFSIQHPFIDYKDSIIDYKTSYQYLMSLPLTSEDLFSEYVKFAMMSLNFEQKFFNIKKGAEIWYGVTKSNIPTIAAIYYKNFNDSTHLYVFTGYSLTYFDKKSKIDLSKLICERIRTILNRDQKRRN